jgi:hypothetical protein
VEETDQIDRQVERIRQKLATIPSLPERGKSFGEETHGFKLGPPLSESELAAFEAEHGITLPAGYRAFLGRIGNGGPGQYGGAGPYYGLHPLENWQYAMVEEGGRLDVPFPVAPDQDFAGDVEWYEAVGLGGDFDEWFPGAIALSDQGCGYYCVLVVTGPARGWIAYTRYSEGPPFFVADDFLDWYEGWLDEMATGVIGIWYGSRPNADTAVLLRAMDEEPSAEWRARIALGLGDRLDEPGVRERLRVAAGTEQSVSVRVAATAVLSEHATLEDRDTLLAAEQDPSAAVRAVTFPPGA